ncbi:linear amide C-N hydrolase [Martelella lutilitoris]|uniref:Linear amide C-N hydrolase n=1 Tax=Martelella lutilitoris TaxID=2583532 RepID=A0A7T7HJG7_9HYPH|nr:linear amide C-N hydrolase [Martelella lutilitoris]QQM30311.1 linear amide C-N hydrolase [Martelella lutilitoris]
MCTSLLYTDLSGSVFAGRTLELPVELPYFAAFLPKGTPLASRAGGHAPLTYESRYDVFGIVVPNGNAQDLKVVEGLNEAGLNFSLLAFADTHGPDDTEAKDTPVLSAIDLGAWMLAQFSTVAEVKNALEKQTVLVDPLEALGGVVPPFHYTVHDKSGASIVIEFFDGKRHIFENPLGVMTNSPRFDWHLTNLNNYTHLNNVDHSSATFLGKDFIQPDSGIATVTLPGSDTAVDRFVRAVYYAQFSEKVDGSEAALRQLGHVMNKFDRPKGASVYSSAKASALTESATKLTGGAAAEKPDFITEYTSWITLIDLAGGKLMLRTYGSLGYVSFDLAALKQGANGPKLVPLEAFSQGSVDADTVMLSH